MSEMTDNRPNVPPDSGPDTPRTIAVSAALAFALLVLFYMGLFVLPPFVRFVAAHNLYNYRLTVEQAVAAGDYDGALAVIERASRELPRDIYFERPELMYRWMGEIWQKQGDAAKSLDAFLDAQAWHFRNIALRGYLPPPSLIRDIVESYFAVGNPGGAYQEARAALDFYPMLSREILQPHAAHVRQDLRIERDLARLEMQARRLDDSLLRLTQCLTADPNLPGVRYALGRLSEQQGDRPRALARYQEELEVNPFHENAAVRVRRMYPAFNGGRTPDLARVTARLREALVAEFVAPEPGKALASFFTVGAKLERAFELANPGTLLFNIQARSTPCDGLWGWVDVRLDGEHVQTLYIDSREFETLEVRVPVKTAGAHRLTIENLYDAYHKDEDRNVFINAVRVYRIGD